MPRRSVLQVVDAKPSPSVPILSFNGAASRLRDVLPFANIEYCVGDILPGFQKGRISFSLGYQKSEVNVVLLAMRFSRLMWPPFDPRNPNPEPLCWSEDGTMPSGGTLGLSSIACERCEFSMWQQRQPPACCDVYGLLLFDVDDRIPFVIAVKRTSVLPLRKLKTTLSLQGRKYAHRGVPANLCVAVRMTTQPVNNHFVLSFPRQDPRTGEDLWRGLTEPEAQEMLALSKTLASSFGDVRVPEVAVGEPAHDQ
jgi:hypothetical protein